MGDWPHCDSVGIELLRTHMNQYTICELSRSLTYERFGSKSFLIRFILISVAQSTSRPEVVFSWAVYKLLLHLSISTVGGSHGQERFELSWAPSLCTVVMAAV